MRIAGGPLDGSLSGDFFDGESFSFERLDSHVYVRV